MDRGGYDLDEGKGDEWEDKEEEETAIETDTEYSVRALLAIISDNITFDDTFANSAEHDDQYTIAATDMLHFPHLESSLIGNQ